MLAGVPKMYKKYKVRESAYSSRFYVINFQDLSQDSIIKQKDKQKGRKEILSKSSTFKIFLQAFFVFTWQLPIDIKYKSIQIKFSLNKEIFSSYILLKENSSRKIVLCGGNECRKVCFKHKYKII